MKRATIILIGLLLGMQYQSFSQWIYTTSSRGNFNFSVPEYPTTMDTLGLLTYQCAPNDNSNISYHIEYIENAYISGNTDLGEIIDTNTNTAARAADPCYVDSIAKFLNVYAQVFQYATQGTIEGFETSDYATCSIRGRELAVRHQNLSGDGDYYFTFTRYYYWNGKLLIFSVSGPEANLTALYSYKNQFFSSIYIY